MVEEAKALSASRRYTIGQLTEPGVDEFIDLGMASRVSGVASVTLRAQATVGRLRAVRLGGRWITKREWLQEYLNSRPQYLKARVRERNVAVQDGFSVTLNDDLEIWILLNQAWQTIQKAREKELARSGISLKRSSMLFLITAIASAGKPVTAGEITRWTLLEKHTVFERIKRMERDGLIKRVPSSGRKAMELVLTQTGKQALERSAKRESISAIASSLSPYERQQFKAILRKLRNAAVDVIEDYTKRVLL
ncbi:MAG: MarR family winged helix-turn-helix transcriptional regulator [Chloroflexota bacterium]